MYGRHFGVYRISIRAPLAGSDDKLPWFCFPGQISIRAPLAGSDNRRRCRRLRPAYFNSRSPCGERRTIFGSRASALAFHSALPLRVATTRPPGKCKTISNFNPRSPCGERHDSEIKNPNGLDFNPRSPCGERRACRGLVVDGKHISIRAPLAGSDYGTAKPWQNVRDISIRAPLAGSDNRGGWRT